MKKMVMMMMMMMMMMMKENRQHFGPKDPCPKTFAMSIERLELLACHRVERDQEDQQMEMEVKCYKVPQGFERYHSRRDWGKTNRESLQTQHPMQQPPLVIRD